ncbi:hypothetical protein [Endozoicomonas euniceicola]|uniref:Methyltransferase type 11 domain-containing protein n=1 Tax=Endozoicomonas euniceicola TaxID=1234143 RepID=A0ABY6GRH5_9GAMM|nr:hypothetical protein [Endozoicomonas euniceicola]UYM15348.1 hypothetical protein NX720_21220 [Endozoicomonas euniceicola]
MKNTSRQKRILATVRCFICTYTAIFLPQPVNATPDLHHLFLRSDILLNGYDDLINLVTFPESKDKQQNLLSYQLPQKMDSFVVYPVWTDDQPSTSGEVPEGAGATADDSGSYRAFLIEQARSIEIEFFRQNFSDLLKSFENSEDALQRWLQDQEVSHLEDILIIYLRKLSSNEERIGRLNSFLQSSPELCYRFFLLLTEYQFFIDGWLPVLPEEVDAQLSGLNERAQIRLRLVLAVIQRREGDVATQNNDYLSTLSLPLPGMQPPQRSVILSLSDFRDEANFTRISENLSLRETLRTARYACTKLPKTPEGYYQGYLSFILSSSMGSYEELITHLQSIFKEVLGFSNTLRDEHGLFYTPSRRWFDSRVNCLDDNPVSLEVGAGSSYRAFLIEQARSIEIEFFRQNFSDFLNSLENSEDALQHWLQDQEVSYLEDILISYLKKLSSNEERIDWLKSLLQSSPELFYRFFTLLTGYRSFIDSWLPVLPEEANASLSGLNERARIRLRQVLAVIQWREGDSVTQNNDYFSILSSGQLPDMQPPQRSVLLSLSDFRNQENFTRLNENQSLSRTLRMARSALLLPETPEGYYQGYLSFIINSSMRTYEELILDLQSMFIGVLGFSHPLRDEHGLFYTPSSRWLDPVVHHLRELTDGNPVGLEVGAGSGSLSHFLNQNYQIPMTATDVFSSYREVTERTGSPLRYDPVTEATALQAVRTYDSQANFLVLSWPAPDYVETQCCWDFVSLNLGVDTDNIGKGLMSQINSPSDEHRLYRDSERFFFSFWVAVIAWNNRGPILFIGEPWNERCSMTARNLLREYLAKNFDAISFRDFYQSPPFANDYPVLYIPKSTKPD